MTVGKFMTKNFWKITTGILKPFVYLSFNIDIKILIRIVLSANNSFRNSSQINQEKYKEILF